MNLPLGKGTPDRGPRPTEHQLNMARIRARTTGESLAHVLSVFMGVGRHGPEAGAGAAGPEAPLTDACDDDQDEDTEDPGQLAPVIHLSGALARRTESARPADSAADDDGASPRRDQGDQGVF